MKNKVFCHGILKNNNEVLILKRSFWDLYPNQWDLPGGFKKSDETYEECVIREFKEETGLDVIVGKLVTIKTQNFNNEIIVVLVYLVECNSNEGITLDSAHVDYKFLNENLLVDDSFEGKLIWYLKDLNLNDGEILNLKKNHLINYLFSNIDLEVGFTKKQASYLKNDIKDDSKIVFVASDFDNYERNDKFVKKILKCFEKINIRFTNYYMIDNRVNKKQAKHLIRETDVLYFMGGNPKSQMENINRYSLKKIFNDYNGIMISVSAGAMNQAKKVVYLDGSKRISYVGIGKIDLLVYPHLNINSIENLQEILTVSKYTKIYSLTNDSFIRIDGKDMIIDGIYYILGE